MLEIGELKLYNTFAMELNDDRELVRRCIEGNAEAWGEFIDRFSGLVYWAIKRKLNKYDNAYLENEVEDILQKEYKDDMNLDDGLKLAIKALATVGDEKFNIDRLDCIIIEKDGASYKKVKKDKLKSILEQVKKK